MGQGTDGRGRPSVFHRTAHDESIKDAVGDYSREVAGVPQMLTIENVMAILQVSRSWCYHDRDGDRNLPWVKIGGIVRLHPHDLKTFIDAQRLGIATRIMRRDVGLTPVLEVELSDYK